MKYCSLDLQANIYDYSKTADRQWAVRLWVVASCLQQLGIYFAAAHLPIVRS